MAEQVVPTTMMIPVPRFIGALLGIVVTVLVSIGIYTWGTNPSYSSLYTGLDPSDAAEVVSALQSAGIPYELNAASGSVMVASGEVHAARLNLASQGLPKGTAMGVEMLQQEQNFGTSQFIESARYHHAMETELARTISTMRNVKSARVHLAIPKHSVFVRKREKPSASVALNLFGGRSIEKGQVNAIIHLVSSGISNLTAENVTVVDQNGRLLSSGELSGSAAMTGRQYDYSQKVERDFERRIEHLLEPIMGVGKVRATVNAKIDFTRQESTEELFTNANETLRSEQSSETSRKSKTEGSGVPGALSNQPPQGGQLVEGAGAVGGEELANKALVNGTRNNVKNYEVDRTIRHSSINSSVIKRLTVAVLVDDKVAIEEGETTRTPLTEDEISRVKTLVEQTIGFDAERGDLVNVINASFMPQEAIEALPEPSLMDNKWVQFALKWIWPFILILIVIFTILRPSIKGLTSYLPPAPIAPPESNAESGGGGSEGNVAQLEHAEDAIPLPLEHDQKVEFAKSMAQQDPKKVANVVKDWVGAET